MDANKRLDIEWWLAATHHNASYWASIMSWANDLQSDGCTGVPEFYHKYCVEHDCHYRTHQRLLIKDRLIPITFSEANYIFRRRMQMSSWFGHFSPMSWWRWLAVQYGAAHQWLTFGGLIPNGD